jgi:hypothetical protein
MWPFSAREAWAGSFSLALLTSAPDEVAVWLVKTDEYVLLDRFA